MHHEARNQVTDQMELSQALYHEPQADGVPYDEDLEPFSKETQQQDADKR
jgi:hypothetical protein